MEELLTLKEYIENHRYEEALLLIEELDEMSREDKLNKIHSFSVILLINLIKQSAERRTTRSWDYSILYSLKEIKKINKKGKTGGYYADEKELLEILEEAYDTAIVKASIEAFEGQFSEKEIYEKVTKSGIIQNALRSILDQ